jgi:KUP system potassium uptake protein
VTRQAAHLGYLPRLRIAHTSEEQIGQVYVPWINWALLAAVLALVFTFKSAEALAYAFGMAVTGTITITTLLYFYVVRHQWGKPRWLVAAGACPLLAVDLLFLAANVTKLPHGAWLPLLIAAAVFTVLVIWQQGRALATRLRERDEGPLRDFVDQLHARRPPLHRVPGTAVFLNRGKATAPLALRANVEHNQVLHEQELILAIETLPVPHVPAAGRLEVDDLGYKNDRLIHVTARFDYMDSPDVPGLLPSSARRTWKVRSTKAASPILPVRHRPAPRHAPGHEPVAQAPVPRHSPAHRRRRRVLPPPPGQDRHHGLPHRALTWQPA